MIEQGQNTGFVAVEPKLGDFIAGGETGILDMPVLPSCDWRPFLPTNVTQLMKASNGNSYGDSNACVSFAAGQSVEAQLNFQIKDKLISADNLAWLKVNGYIDGNGSVLLSKRFIAKMSGTTPAIGNSLPNVWASIRHDGAVPEALWPMPTTAFDAIVATNNFQGPQKFWDVYYAAIPQAVIDLGKQFKDRFPVQYEWLVYPASPSSGQALLKNLIVSPLEIATAVCAGWNTDDPIKACGGGTQHATLLTFVEADRYDILDHYVPYQKQFAADYTITYGMRGVVPMSSTPSPVPPQTFHYTFTKQLTFGSTTNDLGEVKALQQALQFLKAKNGQPYMKVGVFGPFGPQTATALALFESEHGIVDPVPGHNFGPKNRAEMNALLG